MLLNNRPGLKDKARSCLEGRDVWQLAAASIGISIAAQLLPKLFSLILSLIPAGSGLSSLSTVSLLSTISTLVTYACTYFVSFWSLGLTYTAIRWARQEQTSFRDLTRGLRRLFPILRTLLIIYLILLGFLFASVLVSTILFVTTPLSAGLNGLIEKYNTDILAHADILSDSTALAQNPYILLEILPIGEFLLAMLPLFVMFLVAFGFCYLFIFNRYFLATYIVLDQKTDSAMVAITASKNLMKGKVGKLVLLQLSFWWYLIPVYLLNQLPNLGPMILGDSAAIQIVCWVIYIAGALMIYALFTPQVETTYALVYLDLTAPHDSNALPEQTHE